MFLYFVHVSPELLVVSFKFLPLGLWDSKSFSKYLFSNEEFFTTFLYSFYFFIEL